MCRTPALLSLETRRGGRHKNDRGLARKLRREGKHDLAKVTEPRIALRLEKALKSRGFCDLLFAVATRHT